MDRSPRGPESGTCGRKRWCHISRLRLVIKQLPQSNSNFCLVCLEVGLSAWSGIREECSGVAALEQSLTRDTFCQPALPLEEWEPLRPRGGGESALPPAISTVLVCLLSVLPLRSWAPASFGRSLRWRWRWRREWEETAKALQACPRDTGGRQLHPRNEWVSECVCVRVRCWFPRRF